MMELFPWLLRSLFAHDRSCDRLLLSDIWILVIKIISNIISQPIIIILSLRTTKAMLALAFFIFPIFSN